MNTKSKQKVAILIDWYLPGTKAGGPVRSIYSLVSLLKDHFDITIFTTNRDLGSTMDYPDIPTNTFMDQDGIHLYYFSSDQLQPTNIIEKINLIQPDLVYINSFWSYFFSIAIVKAKKNGQIKAPLLLAPRGMLGKGALSLKSAKKRVYLLFSKIIGRYKGLVFHATNEQEKKDIRELFNNNTVLIESNVNGASPMKQLRDKAKGQLKIFYLSRIARVKNLHFALECLRDLPSHISVTYDIYGNNEDKLYWQECEQIIRTLPSNVRVNLCGELPFNDVQNRIINYHALFLPTMNENFGHSIVESLLCGCLALISDQTPWSDIEKWNAGYALSLTDKKAFVQRLVELAELNNEDFNNKSVQAINYISNKLDLSKSTQEYINLFNTAIENRSI